MISATQTNSVVSFTSCQAGTGYVENIEIGHGGPTPASFSAQADAYLVTQAATYDTGTASLTINGTTVASTTYGPNSTKSSIVSALVNSSSSNQLVTLAPSAGDPSVLTITARGGSTDAGYSYAFNFASTASGFSQPSFGASSPSGSLQGGQNSPIYSWAINSYAPNGDVLSMTDSVMGTWSYSYDDMNRLITGNATGGAMSGLDMTWTYDRYGNRWSQGATGTGASGVGQTSFSFSGNNNRIDGYTYDADGNLKNDGVLQYAYDAENRIIAINGQSTYMYDATGTRVAKLSGGAVSSVYILGSGGQQVSEINASGQWMHSNIYPAGGRLIATYEGPGGATAANSYWGRAVYTTDEGNGTTNIAHVQQTDGLGNLAYVCEVSATTQQGSSNTPSSCGLDYGGTGFLTSYTHDPLGNLVIVAQPGLLNRTFVYDGLSRMTSAYNPESGTTQYAYDGAGNVTQRTDQMNTTTTYSYDVLNRLTGKVYSDGSTSSACFQYDQTSTTNGKGRLGTEWTQAAGSTCPASPPNSGVMTMRTLGSYDAMGRPTTDEQCTFPMNCNGSNFYTLNYTYDQAGNVTYFTNGLTGSSALAYWAQYDSADRLCWVGTQAPTQLCGGSSLYAVQSFSPGGGVANATVGPNISLHRDYDSNRMWPTDEFDTQTLNGQNTSLYSWTIPSYAPNGNVVTASDTVMGTWGYTYDDLNRVHSASATAGSVSGLNLNWLYDRYGNRTSQTASGNGSASVYQANLSFNNHNQIIGSSYNADGDLLNDGNGPVTYDAENRIVSASYAPNYVYDAEGRRVAWLYFAPNAATNIWLLGLNGEQVTELNGAGTWLHSNVFAGGNLVATYEGPAGAASPGYHYRVGDWLGTMRAQASSSAVEETCMSYPFGDGLTCNGGPYGPDATEQHFTGQMHEPDSGLDYFGARYYNSSLARFMTPDPSGSASANPTDPQTSNLYAYAGNNPLSNVDPDGLSWFTQPCNDNTAEGANLSIGNRIANFISHLFGCGGGGDGDSQDQGPHTPSIGSGSTSQRSGGISNLTIVLFNTQYGPKPIFNRVTSMWDVTWYPAVIKDGKLVPIVINPYTNLAVGTKDKFVITLNELFDGEKRWRPEGENQGRAPDHIMTGNVPNVQQRWFVNNRRVQVVMGMDPNTGKPILYWQDYVLRHTDSYLDEPHFR